MTIFEIKHQHSLSVQDILSILEQLATQAAFVEALSIWMAGEADLTSDAVRQAGVSDAWRKRNKAIEEEVERKISHEVADRVYLQKRKEFCESLALSPEQADSIIKLIQAAKSI